MSSTLQDRAVGSLTRQMVARIAKAQREVVSKPFAGFPDWEACMAEQVKRYDEATAKKVCGKLKALNEKGVEKAVRCPDALREIAVAALQAEGQVLKSIDGSVVKQSFGSFEACVRSMAQREGVNDPEALCAYIGRRAGKIPGGKKRLEPPGAKQGGSLMKGLQPGSTPVGIINRVVEKVRALGRPLTDRAEFDGIVKQTVAELPADWERWTIPDLAAINRDAMAALRSWGYSPGYASLTDGIGITKRMSIHDLIAKVADIEGSVDVLSAHVTQRIGKQNSSTEARLGECEASIRLVAKTLKEALASTEAAATEEAGAAGHAREALAEVGAENGGQGQPEGAVGKRMLRVVRPGSRVLKMGSGGRKLGFPTIAGQ